MNQNNTPEPGRQSAVPSLWAEPGAAPSPFFTMPTPSTSGDIVPPYSQTPERTPQQPWPVSPQPPGPVTDQQVEQRPDQQPQAPQQGQWQGQGLAAPDPARLRRLCRRLRETHRCPGGGCVLSRARQDNTLGQFPDIR
jgi:hypothetical protein